MKYQQTEMIILMMTKMLMEASEKLSKKKI